MPRAKTTIIGGQSARDVSGAAATLLAMIAKTKSTIVESIVYKIKLDLPIKKKKRTNEWQGKKESESMYAVHKKLDLPSQGKKDSQEVK